MEKLNLDLRSIRSIFDFKVKVIKNEKKFMKIANKLIINEILLVSQQGSDNASMGYQLEGDRYNFANLMSLYDKDICDLCDHDLFPRMNEKMQNPPIKVFIGCAHTFHQHCMNQFVKEQ
jgi:hypothetical protein